MGYAPQLHTLACPALRQLHLQEPAGSVASLLHGCSGLTELNLQQFFAGAHKGLPASVAAIAALPELKSLSLSGMVFNTTATAPTVLEELLQLPSSSLTHLKLLPHLTKLLAGRMSQLSGLTNLKHLELSALPSGSDDAPGSWLSQLVQLTCRHIRHVNAAQQLHYMGSLTALQRMLIGMTAWHLAASDICGIQQLPELTSLQVSCHRLDFHTGVTASISNWTCLTALILHKCAVAPEALQGLTQLQVLTLEFCRTAAAPEELLHAVAQLQQLVELQVSTNKDSEWDARPTASAAAFTALNASTNLRALQLGLYDEHTPPD
jgi:Leucine-rich repeat (LRR) protein